MKNPVLQACNQTRHNVPMKHIIYYYHRKDWQVSNLAWTLFNRACVALNRALSCQKMHVNRPQNGNTSPFSQLWRFHCPCINYTKVSHVSNLVQDVLFVTKESNYSVWGKHCKAKMNVNRQQNGNERLFSQLWRFHSLCINYARVGHVLNLVEYVFFAAKESDCMVCGKHFHGQNACKTAAKQERKIVFSTLKIPNFMYQLYKGQPCFKLDANHIRRQEAAWLQGLRHVSACPQGV